MSLDIEREEQRLDPKGGGRILIERSGSTVVVPIGKWVEISGFGKDTQTIREVRFYDTSEQQRLQSQVFVKVEVLTSYE